MAKSIETKMRAKGLPEAQSAAQIADLVTQAIRDARSLAHGLQPVESKPTGLMLALQELATSMQDVFKMPCSFQCATPVELHDTAVATQLYRIAQEACNNALKHAQARQIEIELKREHGEVVLSVRDNGKGLPAAQTGSQGMGIQIMRYRAAMIGGTLSISPSENGGTVVICRSAIMTR
jgi:signal transduction histidine kinase